MKKYTPLLIILILSFLLYHQTLFVYFSQDDFFHFKVSSTDGSLIQFIKLFGFYPFEQRDIAFYRPISREVLFNLNYFIFGLNHLPFRILSLALHLLNIFLIFFLIQKLSKQKALAFFVSFFYAISTANVATLYYLAGGIQTLLSTTFITLCLIFFIKFLENKSRGVKIFTFVAFLLALGSFESAAIIPILLVGLVLILRTQQRRKEILQLWPFFLITFIYLLLDIFVIGFSSQESQYQVNLNLKTIINSLAWYYSWALGLPEMLIDFVNPGLKLNPVLLRYWGNYYYVIFPTFFITLTLMVITLIYLFLKQRAILVNKLFLFMVIWFPLGILPMIFLPLHKSSHYLTPVLLPFWAALFYLVISFYKILNKKNRLISRLYLSIFLISTALLSLVSIQLQNQTFWAATRGRLAQKLIIEIKSTYPSLPKGSTLYLENDPNYPSLTKEWGGTSKQASLVLNGSDALQLLYGDPDLKVFYQDLIEKPAEVNQMNIYPFRVKIN